MANTKEIKNRIRSIKNTKKITKAMELVAASKMKKAVSKTLDSREYARFSREVLGRVADSLKNATHPYLATRGHKKILVIIVTSNKGLCGAYNSQVFREMIEFLRTKSDREYSFITVGKKGETALERLGLTVIASFPDLSDSPTLIDALPIADVAISEYEKGTFDRVKIIYTNYISALTQKPITHQLLPVSKKDVARAVDELKEDAKHNLQYILEPDSESLVINLIEELSRAHIYQILLESMASEQSARMVAMKNASDAAGEMIDDLTLVFNKARQASITQEISEISAGMASVS